MRLPVSNKTRKIEKKTKIERESEKKVKCRRGRDQMKIQLGNITALLNTRHVGILKRRPNIGCKLDGTIRKNTRRANQ